MSAAHRPYVSWDGARRRRSYWGRLMRASPMIWVQRLNTPGWHTIAATGKRGGRVGKPSAGVLRSILLAIPVAPIHSVKAPDLKKRRGSRLKPRGAFLM